MAAIKKKKAVVTHLKDTKTVAYIKENSRLVLFKLMHGLGVLESNTVGHAVTTLGNLAGYCPGLCEQGETGTSGEPSGSWV